MSEPTNAAEFTVSEISFALKRTVEDVFGFVRVRGEISGYRGPHSSGHAYFALKDDKARIEAVVWRPTMQRLRFRPEEGMEVIATGKLTTYPGSSKYQIVIDALEPAGVGALMALLEERKARLAAEGLFAPEAKRPLPYMPRVIGVVTSPTGAVIRDILHRIADRFPVRVLVWPVRVQGETSGTEVAMAIAGFNLIAPGGPIPRPDVIIVARGGGSLEDLWGFNDEVVVRAAAASEIPLVSAVGHETDWTLIDLAADVRAPTPTAAAEMAVPVRSELMDVVAGLDRRHRAALARYIETNRRSLSAAARGLPRPRDILALPRQRFDSAASNLGQSLRANTAAHRARLDRAAARLSPASLAVRLGTAAERLDGLHRRAGRALGILAERRREALERQARLLGVVSYTAVLARGFALVRDASGQPLRSAAAVMPGAALAIEFADGRIAATADGATPAQAEAAARPSVRRSGRAKPSESQGDLF
ncbi:exodeoxyribonuclease VII large subunit [Methylobrevis albus]|uniref:Exodeoxyribonuclease 7 large subunit n=1 Tax=Methylobrevis albus TaxID=2793297 RepID=A0A931I2S3_9HYPH|nr:exodeoxyribonuclease VII large subunit [Methylobrevis albus]MBH0238233.1 exodeoxyribonuclease VII large subunit [Methylobrevis albus]